ncbi:unnamed protein product [Parajaminaea phylloscopi]
MSSSHQAKLTLRAPPHRDFIQGYPGIPAGHGRSAASIAGSVEVRLPGKGAKASWLRIELRKLETTASGENWGELIGRGPIEVWSARGTAETDSEGKWDLLTNKDFPFKIAIPEGLPPTARIDKQAGISYEVVTSLCIKSRKGLLRREDTSSIIQYTHPIAIEKHELHSTWPIYSVPDDHELMVNQIIARVYRKKTCYAPGDSVEVRIILTSKNVSPVKIKSIAFSIRETVTFKGGKRSSRMLGGSTRTANQRSENIAQKSQNLGLKLYKGDVKTYDLALTIPKTHALMTIQTAKHIEVAYSVRVYVDTKNPIILDHLPLTMTSTPRSTSNNIVPAIGFVPGLSAALDSAQAQQYGNEIQRPASADHAAGRLAQRRQTGDSYGRPHQPTRSFSFLSSAPPSPTTDRSSANLSRRDTVMTTASGPGWAGRGVPGQIFSWRQDTAGAASSAPFGRASAAPRPAFAGPASIYEGRELAPEENRALFHHSLTSSLGQVFEGQEPVPAVNHYHEPSMPITSSPSASQVQLHNQWQQHSSTSGGPEAATPAGRTTAHGEMSPVRSPQDAEAEKERLYQRAREQAERNQRRAAAAAASNPAALGTSVGRASPTGDTSIVSPTTSVNEKQTLYERARREAERYQANYEQGASFPKEDLTAAEDLRSQSHLAQASRTNGHSSHLTTVAAPKTVTSAAGAIGVASPRIASPVPSATHAQNLPSAEEEKRRFAAAQAQRDAFLQQQSASASGHSSASQPTASQAGNGGHVAAPSRSQNFASAEDEKRMLYERAKAEVEAGQRQAPPLQPPPAQGATQGRPTSSSSYLASIPASSQAGRGGGLVSYPSAEEEKRKLYEKAKAEVEANQPTPSASFQTGVSASASSAFEEKAQLKRYLDAQEAVAKHHGQPPSSSSASNPYDGGLGGSSSVMRPEPYYASGYAPITATSPAAHSPPPVRPPKTFASHGNGSASPSLGHFANAAQFGSKAPNMDADADDTASIISLPLRSASVVAGKQRSTPSRASSPPPPALPALTFSDLSGALPSVRPDQYRAQSGHLASEGGRSPSVYAPRMASPNWHEDDYDDDNLGMPGGLRRDGTLTAKAPPPPLPPKTPLAR